MAKAYPPVLLTLVCDDIRAEVFRKNTFVGVYTGDTILTRTVPLRLNQIAFYQKLRAVEGEYDIAFAINDPSGKQLVRTPSTKLTIKGPEVFVDLSVIFTAPKFEQEGEYTLCTFFDDQQAHEYRFKLVKGELQT